MSPVLRTALAALIGATLSLPAMAADGNDSHGRKKGDPNEVVCEKQEVLGSRLAAKRVCKTRSEWAEQRRIDRALVDRSQTSACQQKAGC